MQRPAIERAIPKRRYHIGTFGAVILGEVESGDDHAYRHILALVPEGDSDPILYVTAEELAEPGPDGQRMVVRVVAEEGEKVLGPDDRWQELDAFVDDALQMVRRVMRLTDEEPVRLM